MCFPSKRQKANFTDDNTPSKPKPNTENGIKEDTVKTSPSSAPAPSATAPTTATSPQIDANMTAPKVAIVIYSLYGHIAKRMSWTFFYTPYTSLKKLYLHSRRISEGRYRERRRIRHHLPVRFPFRSNSRYVYQRS